MCNGRWRSSVAVLFLFASATASAAPGLDLALLIDRSTSMAHRSRRDDALLGMTVDLLARNAGSNRVDHRIAVIEFGSSARVELPFTSARRGKRLPHLHYKDLGETNVLAAFVLAEKLFHALPADPSRRRAIVLLTDGIMFIRGSDPIQARDDVRRFAATHLPRDGITLSVLLLDTRNQTMWSSLGHVEPVARGSDQLLAAAHETVTRLAGTQTAASAPSKANPSMDTLVVPPYLEIIVFDIFRGSRDASVEIFPPASAHPIRAGVNGIESLPAGDVLATFVVPHPQPGAWTIRKTHPRARVRVLSQQFFPRGILEQPAETETVPPCHRIPLVYRVLDDRGHPLNELREYALSLDVALATPGGTTSTIEMRRDVRLGAGGFRSTTDPLCQSAGRYWTDVRITAIDANGHRIEIFRDRWSGFSVTSGNCNSR